MDLDPRNDAEFEGMTTLSPHTLLADGYDGAGRNIYSADDQGGLWLKLTTDEHAELSQRLSEVGVGESVLSPQPRAPLATPFRLAISGMRARSRAVSEGS